MKTTFISIIIPGFNEENRIKNTLNVLNEFCSSHFQSYEIIFVDDGSYDQTYRIVDKLSKEIKNIICLRYNINKGKGYAIRFGMTYAKGDYIFFTDADLPYVQDFFVQAVEIFQQTRCDIVVGNRRLSGSKNEAQLSQKRQWASKIFSLLVRKLFKIDIADTQCGIKGFSKDCVEKIILKSTIDGYAFDVEIYVLAGYYQWQIKSLPVTLINNQLSKIQLRFDSFYIVWELLKIVHRSKNRCF